MTTIAYRDGVLAGDTMTHINKMKAGFNTRKVFRLPGGAVGYAGDVDAGEFFVSVIKADFKENGELSFPKIKLKGVTAIIAVPGTFHLWEGGWVSTAMPYFAIGHGMNWAIAAMDAGATAREAVAVSIKRDLYTGGKVQSINVG
jgi:hypothetical protein